MHRSCDKRIRLRWLANVHRNDAIPSAGFARKTRKRSLRRSRLAGTATIQQLLEAMASDEFGLARLTQALECLKQSLVSPEGLRDFFDDLYTHWTSSSKAWHVVWDEVARGVAPNCHGARGHIRRTLDSLRSAPPPEHFTTVVDERVWQQWHLVDKFEDLVDAGLPIPSFPIGRDAAAAEDFRTLTESRGWARISSPASGSWLGRPSKQNANCWVSSALLAPGEVREVEFSTAQQDMAARGMVPDPNLAAVRYIIATGALPTGSADDPNFGCRPGLADCGSVWFRITSRGSVANRHRKHGWGSTVNLDKLGPADTGLPERVVRSIPVDSAAVVRVELLLPEPAKGGRRPPSQKRFVKRLKSHRSAADIVKGLLDIMNSGSKTGGVTA